jgi:hypothetical protein
VVLAHVQSSVPRNGRCRTQSLKRKTALRARLSRQSLDDWGHRRPKCAGWCLVGSKKSTMERPKTVSREKVSDRRG